MGWVVAIPVAIGGFIFRKRVQIIAGTLIVTYYDDVGRKIGEFIGQEAANAATKELEDAGATVEDVIGDIAGEIGSLSLQFVRGFGAAVVDGVDFAFDAIRQKLRNREPDVVAGFTVGAIAILTGVFLYHSVKNAKDAL